MSFSPTLSVNYNEWYQGHKFHRDQLEGLETRLRCQLSPGATLWVSRGVSHPVEDGDSEDLGDFRCMWLPPRSGIVFELPQGEPELRKVLENDRWTRLSDNGEHLTSDLTAVRCFPSLPQISLTIYSI